MIAWKISDKSLVLIMRGKLPCSGLKLREITLNIYSDTASIVIKETIKKEVSVYILMQFWFRWYFLQKKNFLFFAKQLCKLDHFFYGFILQCKSRLLINKNVALKETDLYQKILNEGLFTKTKMLFTLPWNFTMF